MSFEEDIDKAVEVLEALERLSPRDEKGEYFGPYLDWIRSLRYDITSAKKYLAANQVVLADKGKEEKDG